MQSTPNRARRWGPPLVLLAAMATAGGVFAYRTVFARPGESSLRLVPAEAIMVATLDLSPSPSQALTFKRIESALARNGLQKHLSSPLVDIVLGGAKGLEEIRPFALRSGAVAMLPNGDRSPRGLILLGLSDGPRVAGILKTRGKPFFYKGTPYFRLPGRTDTNVMVVDDLLALSDDPVSLHQVRQVRDGSVPAIESSTEFVAARAKAPADANVMLFLSPKLWASAMPRGKGNPALDAMGSSWTTMSLSVRESGLQADVAGAYDLQKAPELKALAGVKPLRHDLFAVLPSGAYGLFATSQPAKALRAMLDIAAKEPEAAREIEKGMKEMLRETGLDGRRDVLPALEGNAVLASYPSAATPDAGLDLLLVVDDANGADPSAVADKLRAYAERKFVEEKPGKTLFASHLGGGSRAYVLNEELASEARKDIGRSLKGSGARSEALIGGKTFAFAMVDKALIAATSKELLDRAVETYRRKTSALAGHTALASGGSAIQEGAQTFAVFSLSRIARGVSNTLDTDRAGREASEAIQSVLGAFERVETPLLLKGKTNEDGTYSGGAFVPLDYDKLIDLIGKSTKG